VGSSVTQAGAAQQQEQTDASSLSRCHHLLSALTTTPLAIPFAPLSRFLLQQMLTK